MSTKISVSRGREVSSSFIPNLALTLESQGQLEMAEELTRKALKRRREVLEPPYLPDTLSIMKHLIALLKKEEKDEEADELRIKANGLATRYESGGGSGSRGEKGLTAGVNGEVVQAAVLVTAMALVSGYYYH
jgi:hypothetical protein